MMTDLQQKFYSTHQIPRVILKICGCFPNRNGEYQVRNLYFITFYMFYSILLTSTELWTSWPNILNIAQSAELCIAAIGSFVKFYTYTVNRNLIYKLLSKVRDDYWDIDIHYNEEEIKLVELYAKQNNRFIILMSGNISVCAILKMMKAFVFMYIIPNPENPGQRFLPLVPWVPFNIDVFADPYYQIIYSTTICAMLFSLFVLMAVDALLCFFIINLTCQYRILKNRIENFTNFEIYKTEARTPEEFLKLCIRRHQALNQRSVDLEISINKIMLMELLLDCPFLCMGTFLLAQEHLELYYRIDTIFIVVLACLRLFSYCFPADRLTEQALGIAEAAYNSNWIIAPNSTKKLILMIIIRSQREICITAGKFVAVNIKTFETVFRSAMSYVTVLTSMTSKE